MIHAHQIAAAAKLVLMAAVVACVVAPSAASAQPQIVASIAKASGADSGWTLEARLGTSSSQIDLPISTHIINRADCAVIKGLTNAKVDIIWQYNNYQGISVPNYTIKMAPPEASCDDSDFALTTSDTEGGCKMVKPKSQLPLTGAIYGTTTTVDLKELLGTKACDELGDTSASLSFIVTDGTGRSTLPASARMTFTIDAAGPTAPTIGSVSAGNKNLKVSWTVADESTTPFSRVYWSKLSFPASAPTQATSRSDKLTGSSYQITGLTNGETYYVAVTGMDGNDNESVADKVVQASPVPVQDMWQYYKASGGTAEGGYFGCSAAPLGGGSAGGAGGVALLAALAALLLFRGRALVPVVALALLAGSLAPTTAHAESPQTMSVDARVSNYQPMIDREFSTTTGATPYGDIIGQDGRQWGLSFDWRIWYGFGEFSAGMSVGYWKQSGKSRAYDGSASDDETELLVVPITLDVIYRFNWLAKNYRFPLVPYVKGGLAYGLWWSRDGTGETSSWTGPDNKVYTGRGGVAGLHGVLGMRLLLDVFEPKAARGFDLEMGVNHSYLFIEYQKLSLTNFGNAKALDLSDDLLVFGIAFDI